MDIIPPSSPKINKEGGRSGREGQHTNVSESKKYHLQWNASSLECYGVERNHSNEHRGGHSGGHLPSEKSQPHLEIK
jgi:hypothetical protein